ncbi:corticotropin-releasing factor-binding protein-like protein [Leptotrombidium deliense]|uniref:Corticotropin-releasing factor-binding protein n=1 Tax=Leptotrombidium deliense TaxID=299467 RepID=A0A443SR57_9ACAR|nr:corticotropin-releasing factor-binding protein-like protein [Leptotrombidium deliense]
MKCIFIKTEPGVYQYVSPGGNHEVCGFYVIAEPTEFTVFEFEEFDVSCSARGLLSVIDGWELNGQFFPGTDDHSLPRKERYHEYCGTTKPWKKFRMSQNVGLIEFRIPTKGEGFRVNVKFVKNEKPCNAVLQNPVGVYTLRNYGQAVNCTISIIFPEKITVLAASVAAEQKVEQSEPSENVFVETGIVKDCKQRGLKDYVEIKGGDGLDPGLMMVAEDFCGVKSTPSKREVDVACGNTAIRLVSSGQYDNSVTIGFDLLLDFSSSSLICPALLEAL